MQGKAQHNSESFGILESKHEEAIENGLCIVKFYVLEAFKYKHITLSTFITIGVRIERILNYYYQYHPI